MSGLLNTLKNRNPGLLIVCGLITLLVLSIFVHCDIAEAQVQVVEERIAPGVLYREFYHPEGPWAIQVLEVQRDAPDMEFEAVLGGEYVLGIEPLNKIAERMSRLQHYPAAGINGDFYLLRNDPFQGDPTGLCVINGELISSPVNRSAFVILEDGKPYIDRFQLKGTLYRDDGEKFEMSGVNQSCPDDGIVIITPSFYTATRAQGGSVQLLAGSLKEHLKPEGTYDFTVQTVLEEDSVLVLSNDQVAFVGLGKGAAFLEKVSTGEKLHCTLSIYPSPGQIRHAIGGTPRLLRNGEISIEAEEERVRASFVETRHPRTALGFNNEYFFLVTVDGRQPEYSVGMSLIELARFLKELGAIEALNLDGGGSTTMWVLDEVRNRPSDGRVRPIANALILFSKVPIKK